MGHGLGAAIIAPARPGVTRLRAMSSLAVTAATTLFSGGLGGLIALGLDNWRAGSARRRAGREALEEFQRVMADWSAFAVITIALDDEAPLENPSWHDLAAARRAAYPYRDLLRGKDRDLVERNSVSYDRCDEGPIDSRQPYINTWAIELQNAIDRAFKSSIRR